MRDSALADPRARDQAERELKFALPEALADLARRRLEAICVRDPDLGRCRLTITTHSDLPSLAKKSTAIDGRNSGTLVRPTSGQRCGRLSVEAKLPSRQPAAQRCGTKSGLADARPGGVCRIPHPAIP